MRRIRFEVAYDGTEFSGWQVQPGFSTVQGTLEEMIGQIEGARVHVAASGRTDAGVHACAQVAAVTLANPIPCTNFRRAVNRLLPLSIRICNVQDVDLSFHPRFDAKRKTYEYRIFRDEICPPFERNYALHYPYPLAEQAMMEAAVLLVGEHDFTAFAATDHRDQLGITKVRTVFESKLVRAEPESARPRSTGSRLIYTVKGSGFLKHMVRNMVGVLIEVGKRNLSAEDVLARLRPGSGIRPGPTAPGRGLFLVSVEYD